MPHLLAFFSGFNWSSSLEFADAFWFSKIGSWKDLENKYCNEMLFFDPKFMKRVILIHKVGKKYFIAYIMTIS